MASVERTKWWLDWLQHGYLLFQLFCSIASGKTVKALLTTHTSINPIWISPIWWASTALAMAALVFLGNRFGKQPRTTSHVDRFSNPQWEIVSRKEFRNEAVELDGKRFYQCQFANARLTYNGKAPVELIDCSLSEGVIFETANPAITEYQNLVSILQTIGPTTFKSVDKDGKLIYGSSFVREVKKPEAQVTEVTKNDPRIYVEVVDESVNGRYQTRLLLHNRGGQVAHSVHVETLNIAGHSVTFDTISDIDKDAKKEILPLVESMGTMQQADLVGLTIKAWNSGGELTEEFPMELLVSYRDFSSKKEFVSKVKLMFAPIKASFMRRNPNGYPADWKVVEVRDISFSHIPSRILGRD